MVMPAGKEIKANMIGRHKIEPMAKEMIVPWEKAPKGSLDKNEVQVNKLTEGKKYKIIAKSNNAKSERREEKFKGEIMTLIKCYPNHYLFKGNHGIKHSFSKANHRIGEWVAEECM